MTLYELGENYLENAKMYKMEIAREREKRKNIHFTETYDDEIYLRTLYTIAREMTNTGNYLMNYYNVRGRGVKK